MSFLLQDDNTECEFSSIFGMISRYVLGRFLQMSENARKKDQTFSDPRTCLLMP